MRSFGKNKVFFSAFVISFGVFLSRITGLFRDIIFASFLGTGIVAEAFYISFRLPNTFRRIFAEGAFSNAFVPIFSSKVKENRLDANSFSSKVFVILLVFLTVLTIFMEIFMPKIISIINPGFLLDKEKFSLAVFLSRITFPYIILISITAFFGSILNSINLFWPFSIISVILNVVLIFGLIFARNIFSNSGECLAYFAIFAGVLQLIFVGFFCIKNKVFPSFKTKNINEYNKNEDKEDIKLLIKKFIPAVISSGILQINIFIDGIFASFFSGAISYLYYADRIGQFPLSMIGYSLSVAILPSLSVAFKEEKYFEILSLQKKSLNIAMFFSIPAMLLICELSKNIISFVYERGVFTDKDTIIVAKMLSIYAISIPFNVMLKIFFSCFYAQKDTKTPMKISAFSLLFNVILNLIIINLIGMYCVVVSTTLSSILSCILAIFLLKKNNIFFLKIRDLFFSLKVLFISILTCLIALLLRDTIQLLLLLIIVGCFYMICCFLIKILSINDIKKINLYFKK